MPLQVVIEPFGEAKVEQPRLFVLSAGVDKYAMKALELQYAVKDARAVADALKTDENTPSQTPLSRASVRGFFSGAGSIYGL